MEFNYIKSNVNFTSKTEKMRKCTENDKKIFFPIIIPMSPR